MSYTQFKEFKKSQPAKVQKYLLATMFTKLVKDERGRASIYDYYCYVERRSRALFFGSQKSVNLIQN